MKDIICILSSDSVKLYHTATCCSAIGSSGLGRRKFNDSNLSKNNFINQLCKYNFINYFNEEKKGEEEVSELRLKIADRKKSKISTQNQSHSLPQLFTDSPLESSCVC